jgi:hypothetical protein
MSYQRSVGTVFGDYRGSPAYPTALSPDGSSIYMSHTDLGVIRGRTSDGATLDRTLLPAFRAARVRVSDDGKWLFVVESSYESVSRVAVISLQ